MAGAKPHQRIIKQVAKRYFKPLGLTVNTTGRMATDDHGHWYITVEFQPSGWASGTYLNVGCDWLFSLRDYRVFTLGYRESDFIEYVDDEQFGATVERLCRVAEEKVQGYRSLLADPRAAATVLARETDRATHRLWAAACLFAIGDAVDSATDLLREISTRDDDHSRQYHADASALAGAVDSGDHLRWLTDRVAAARAAQRLPPIVGA